MRRMISWSSAAFALSAITLTLNPGYRQPCLLQSACLDLSSLNVHNLGTDHKSSGPGVHQDQRRWRHLHTHTLKVDVFSRS